MPKRFKEHQHLLIRRESRIVIGRHAVNLWLLILVMTTTFISVAFSVGSMDYLRERMNDPFTNWVNVTLGGNSASRIGALKETLLNNATNERYCYDGLQTEKSTSINLISERGNVQIFEALYYEDFQSDLIAAVLNQKNVVSSMSIAYDNIPEQTIGVIITAEALLRLGYEIGNAPAFVDYSITSDTNDMMIGYEMVNNTHVRAPLPLLAVVKRLPMNMEVIAPKMLKQYEDDDSQAGPFKLAYDSTYVRSLYFFVPDNIENFEEEALSILPDSLNDVSIFECTEESILSRMQNWKSGNFYRLYLSDDNLTPTSTYRSVSRLLLKHYSEAGVERFFDYRQSNRELSSNQDNILSIHFTRLDSIRSFGQYVTEKSGLHIEMTQMNSKENFAAVSVMANILSWAMILFSIICIVIFIVNMLQSYFQRVKRNLGTFKAFGITNRDLTNVYAIIVLSIVLSSLIISLSITWLVQLILPLIGVMREQAGQMFNYLSLGDVKTLWTVLVIVASSILTVFVVMHRLLRQTPGDLIYDR